MISASLWIIGFLFCLAIVIAIFSAYKWQTRKRGEDESFRNGLLSIIENDHEAAIKHLKIAASRDTQNIEAYVILGDLLRQQGNIAKAKQIHASLLARAFIKPKQKARVYKSLALDSVKENKFEKAVEYIQQAIKTEPDEWAKKFLLDMLERLQKWDEAGDLLDKIDGDKRISALYKMEQGKTIMAHEPHKARIIFKEGLKLDHECIPCMMLIGDAYASENRLKDAIEWWTKIIEHYPAKAILVIDRLESAYYELGEFDNARMLYRKILDIHPEAESVRLALASIYEKMGEMNAAKQILQQTPALSEAIALREARVEFLENNPTRAQRIIQKLIDRTVPKNFVCSVCGYKSEEPLWHCPNCFEWNTFGI